MIRKSLFLIFAWMYVYPSKVVLGQSYPPSPQGGLLENPLQSDSLVGFLTAILDVLLTLAIPIIVFFIIYAGFLYVTARGNENQITKAHQALLWSVVGGVIVLGAKLIIDVIQGTVEAL